MNYTANVHGLNLLLVENGGSAAFPLFPRFHGSGAGLQPVPAQKMATIARGQIPCAAANEIPGFPCSLRKLGAPSVFPFPSGVQSPLCRPGPAIPEGSFPFLAPSSQWKVRGLVQPIPRMGIPTFLGNNSEDGSRGSLWNEPGEGPQLQELM